MSATIDGQKGYDYQHIVIACYTLQLIDKISYACTEVQGHEDAYFQLSIDGTSIAAELQVKKRKKRFILKDIAQMLCHFEEGSTTSCLLTRMMNNSQLQAYFITDASVSEEVGKLCISARKDTLEHVQFKPTQTILRQLSKELGNVKDKSKTLSPARGLLCQRLAADFSSNIHRLRTVMARCFLIEGMAESDLFHRMDLLLTSQHKVATSSRTLISDKLIKLVNQSKGDRDGFLSSFKTILHRSQIHLPQLPSSYIPRPDEDDLKETLLKEGYLLLTGPYLCGKSATAKSIGWSLMLSSNMISAYSNSIDSAEAFLLSAGNEEKLYLLDDPFGHIPETPITNQLLKLNSLINNLPKHTRRYLIVTSNEKVLQTVFLEKRLPWKTLVVSDRTFLERIWIRMMNHGSKADSMLFDGVLELLRYEPTTALLQPGHLDHLANSAPHVKLSSLPAIRDFAYIDAERIMLEIPHKFKKDFALLSCLASTIKGCFPTDIAFASDETAEEQPGLLMRRAISRLRVENPRSETKYPFFERTYNLSTAQRNILDYFEDRGYIIEEEDQYRFRHPIYLQAARLCLMPSSELSHQDIKQLLIRSLSTVNYEVAANAIKTISWIIQLPTTLQQKSYLRHLLEVVEVGLRSIFPSIQDESLYVLLQHYDRLSVELQRQISDKIEYSSTNIDDIQWHNGIPFIPERKQFEFKSMGDREVVSETVAEITAGQLTKGAFVSPQLTWEYLVFLETKVRKKKARLNLNIEPLKKALLYSESFIKGTAAYLLAASVTDNEIEFLEKLFHEDDPLMLFNVVKGAWRAYPYFTSLQNKELVLQYIINAFSQKWMPLRSIDLVTQFDIGYSSHSFDWMYEIEEVVQSDMWEVWARVTPIVFDHLPVRVNYHAPRFMATLKTSLKRLPVSANLKIAQSWVGWIKKFPDQYESRRRHLEDFLFYFCSFMLELSSRDRLLIVSDLTSIKVTILRGIIFRNFQLFWEELTAEEQNLILCRLKEETKGVQVIVLTGFTNASIQSVVCGQSFDKDNMPELLSIIGEERLLSCLTMIYIESDIYYIDYVNYGFWNDVLRYFVSFKDSPASRVAIYQLIKGYRLDNNTREQLKWPDIDETITDIYTRSIAEIKDWMLATLLFFCEEIINQSGKKLSDFFALLSKADRDVFLAKLIDYIEILSEDRILRDLSKELNTAVAKYLQEDAHALTLLSKDDSNISQTAETCLMYFGKGLLRTKAAFTVYEDWQREHSDSIPSEYGERFQKEKSTFEEIVQFKRERLFEEVHQPFNHLLLSEL